MAVKKKAKGKKKRTRSPEDDAMWKRIQFLEATVKRAKGKLLVLSGWTDLAISRGIVGPEEMRDQAKETLDILKTTGI